MAALIPVACSSTSSNIGRYYQGQSLHVSVASIERVDELRYRTIDPEKFIRTWRIAPSEAELELVLVQLKVENHTAVSAVINVEQQAAELRDFLRGSYFPVDLPNRQYRDLRDSSDVTIRMDKGQCFDPRLAVISPGTTVNWVNVGDVAHFVTINADNGDGGGSTPATSPPLGPGGSYPLTFDEPGVWDYICSAEDLPDYPAQLRVEMTADSPLARERSIEFIHGPFELLKGEGIVGWMVFEAPEGTEFRDLRWRAGDSVTIPF